MIQPLLNNPTMDMTKTKKGNEGFLKWGKRVLQAWGPLVGVNVESLVRLIDKNSDIDSTILKKFSDTINDLRIKATKLGYKVNQLDDALARLDTINASVAVKSKVNAMRQDLNDQRKRAQVDMAEVENRISNAEDAKSEAASLRQSWNMKTGMERQDSQTSRDDYISKIQNLENSLD